MSTAPAPTAPILPTTMAGKWWLAIRPRTLPAGAMPVVVASALAFADNQFKPVSAIAALVCAVLIQIATNFINEIYDHRKGADKVRVGPTRTVAAGLITSRTMTRAALLVLFITSCIGLYLVLQGGWVILAIGVASILFAWAYTGGPYPLGYLGLGDIFVFLFFGLAATVGTYFVQAHTAPASAWILALAPGALSANILGANNIRDIPTDRAVGKNTLAVRFGEKGARLQYAIFTVLAYVPPVALAVLRHTPFLLLPLLTVPLAAQTVRDCYKSEGRALIPVLVNTAKLLTLHSLLFAAGFVLSRFIVL